VHTDPVRPARATNQLLEQIVEVLAANGLPDLERNERGIFEGKWFRFHRNLRFGVGTDDSTHSVQALVAVDREPVPHTMPIPALLMNGSPAHMLPPYREGLAGRNASRSGSGTGRLFIWLDAVRQALEADPSSMPSAIEIPAFRSDRPPRDAHTAIEMYELFARDAWLDTPLFPRLLHGAPCEGVAQASFVAVHGDRTLVMGSPLYIRVRSLSEPPSTDGRPSRRFFRHLRKSA